MANRFKSILITGMIIFIPVILCCQTLKIKFTDRQDLKNITFNNYDLTSYKLCNNNIYIFQKVIDTIFHAVEFDSQNNSVKREIILNYNLTSNRDYFSDLYISNDTAIMLTGSFLLLLKETKPSFFEVISKTSNKKGYNTCYLHKEKIVVTNCYNFHPLDAVNKCGFKTYNRYSLDPLIEKQLEFDGLGFTHFVYRYMDFHNGNILLSNALKNKIAIYNLDGVKIDSIGDDSLLNSGIEKIPVNYSMKKGPYSLKDSIIKTKEFNNKISRVEKVFYINDSVVITTIKPIKKGDLRVITIWKKDKKNQKWSVTYTGDRINDAKYFNWSYSRNLVITNNKIYFVDIKIPKKIKLITENYLKKNPLLNLYRYAYSF